MMVDVKRLPLRKDLVVNLTSNKTPPNIASMKLVVAVFCWNEWELAEQYRATVRKCMAPVAQVL